MQLRGQAVFTIQKEKKKKPIMGIYFLWLRRHNRNLLIFSLIPLLSSLSVLSDEYLINNAVQKKPVRSEG